MPSISSITGKIVRRNGTNILPEGQIRPISCDNTIMGISWLTPEVKNGHVLYVPNLQSVKPSVDSIKTVKIKLNDGTRDMIYVAINDTDTVSAFQDKCNGCCGDTPEMDAVVIPTPIVEDYICVADGDNAVFKFAIPANGNGLQYKVDASFNGAYATPDPDTVVTTAVDTPAELLSVMNTNYGYAGTFTLQNGDTILQLSSTTTKSAGIDIGLVPEPYCMPIPATPTNVDNIIVGGVQVDLCTTLLSRANPQAVLNELSVRMPGSWIVTTSGGNPSLQYTGLQLPSTLRLGTVTKASFVAGVCA